MQYFTDFTNPIDEQEKFDFYSLDDLFNSEERYIYGAPNLSEKKLLKLLNLHRINEESPESIEYLKVANAQTSGIKLRFKTSSKHLAVKAQLVRKYAHLKMCLYVSSGFDVYRINGKHKYHMTVIAPCEPNNIFSHTILLPGDGEKEHEIFFPCYNEVVNFSLGVEKGSTFKAAHPHSESRAIIFYGHSGTQGASASRSGNAYPNIVSRNLDCEIFNYSFSAACRAEVAMADAIANNHKENQIRAIVVDYSHNAKSIQEFSQRYLPFYNQLRKHYPDTPIILIGAFMANWYDKIISELYNDLKKVDKQLYYLDISELFKNIDILSVSIDKIHYTDTGMFWVANKLCDLIRNLS